MKLRVADRILVALAGLLILSACAAVIAQAFFQVDVIGFVSRVFTSQSLKARAAVICGAVFFLLLGGYCFFVLFRHRSRRDKFVQQKNDSGDLNISIKALENMVSKCLEQHPEIKVNSVFLQNQRDGLIIELRGSVAGGVSIPLTVEAAQRQIKQYVTACSGVEIKNITVQIDSSGPEAENAPFRIAPPVRPLLNDEGKTAQEKAAPVQNAPVQEAPAAPAAVEEKQVSAAPAPTPAPAPVPDDDDDDDRPLHQRLFKPQNEPCIVPAPPVEAETSVESVTVENEGAEENAVPADESDTDTAVPGPGSSAEDAEISEADGAADDTASENEADAPTEENNAEDKTSESKKAALKSFEDAQSLFDDTVTGKADSEVE